MRLQEIARWKRMLNEFSLDTKLFYIWAYDSNLKYSDEIIPIFLYGEAEINFLSNDIDIGYEIIYYLDGLEALE